MMKKLIFILVMSVIFVSCDTHLDFQTNYDFNVSIEKYHELLEQDESCILSFFLQREKKIDGAKYTFKYFQSKGHGYLTYNGILLEENKAVIVQNITKSIPIYYTSLSSDKEEHIEFTFTDNFGNEKTANVIFKKTSD